MRIVKLEDLHADAGWRVHSFLKLTTDEGLIGWCEYNEQFGAGGVTELIHAFAPAVIGWIHARSAASARRCTRPRVSPPAESITRRWPRSRMPASTSRRK